MRMKRFVVLCLVLINILSLSFADVAFASEFGMTFAADKKYNTLNPLSALPSTFEATVMFPKDYTARGGVIIGNYKGSGTDCVSLEIFEKGVPRLYMIDDENVTHDFKFSDVNIYTGEWVHLAIVKDSLNSKLYCYINGELKQTIEKASCDGIEFKNKIMLGGDLRNENAQYFKGKIKNIALFEDVRTAQEIAQDYSSIQQDSDALMLYYDLSSVESGTYPFTIEDLSPNGVSMTLDYPWVDNKEPVYDYAYSFAVIGDTQTLTYYYPGTLTCIYDWIVENKDSKKIEYVLGLGDITDKSTDAEWALAKAVIQKMDGVVPYSLVRGNHDTASKYKEYFTYSEYEDRLDGSFDGSMLSTYQKITVGNNKYLIMNLDLGAKDEVLEWANEIIAANPDYNVIITTHIYLYLDGNYNDSNSSSPATKYVPDGNNGIDIWNKLVSKHENIVLVLSGHHPTDKIVVKQSEGVNGNIVTQMLVDPQTTDKNIGPNGLVAMLYFSEDGKNVDVEYYSTVRDKYFLEENQFSLELDVVESDISSEEEKIPKITVNDITFDINLEGNSDVGTVYAALYDSYNKLKAVKQYPASENVRVSFESGEKYDHFKIVWWYDMQPVTSAQTVVLR